MSDERHRVLQRLEDLRTQSGTPAPEKNRAPEQSTKTRWEADLQYAERLRRMTEKAEQIGYGEATQALLAMVDETEYFERMGNVFLGPTQQEMTDRMERTRETDRQAHQQLQYIVDDRHQKFNVPDPRGFSDWARLLNVIRTAVVPGPGIPGALEVRPPREEGVRDAGWEKFRAWCLQNSLNPTHLAQVGERLRREMGFHGVDAKTVQEKLAIDLGKLDQVLGAGYQDSNDIRILDTTYGGYKTLEGIMRELDPKLRNQVYEQAKQKAHEAMLEAARKYGSGIRYDGYTKRWTYRHDYDERKLNELFRTVRDPVFEEESARLAPRETPLRVSARSVANKGHAPIVAIVARQGERMTPHEGLEKIVQGLHPVSPGLIRAVVGEENIHVRKISTKYDHVRGAIVNTVEYRLVSEGGPVLGLDQEQARDQAAIEAFAERLMDMKSLGSLKEKLPFMRENERLLEGDVQQVYHRSRGKLYPEFDLREWYIENLEDLGSCTSVAEALVHAKELTLTLDNVFFGRGFELEQLQEDYPTKIEIGGKQYKIEYKYIPRHEDRHVYGYIHQESFTATIDLVGFTQRIQDVLSWKETRIQVGPAEHPLAVEIHLGRVRSFTGDDVRSTDIPYLQEIVDEPRLREAWQGYPRKGDMRPATVDLTGDFPDARALLAEPIPPFDVPLPVYATAVNGKELFPAPFVDYIYPQFVLRLAATQQEAETSEERARQIFKIEKAKAERIANADPSLIKRYGEEKAELDGFEQRLRSLAWIFLQKYDQPASMGYVASIGGLRRAAADMVREHADYPGALHELSKLRQLLEKIEVMQAKYDQAKELLKQFRMLNPMVGDYDIKRLFPEIDDERYVTKPAPDRWTPAKPAQRAPSMDELDALLAELNQRISGAKRA